MRSYEIPIRIRALKTANIYVIETESRKILIDSGMGPEVDEFLRSSGEDPRSFDHIVLSHLHIDHIGGAAHLRSEYGTPVGMGRGDVELMNRIKGNPDWFEKTYTSQLRENGMPESMISNYMKETPIMREAEYYHKFEVDDVIDSSFNPGGNREIRIIEVPGHSPGSICVHLPKENILFTGDHVLRDITPNISKYVGIRDSLGSYISSLQKLMGIHTDHVLPGHGKHFTSIEKRAEELVHHHRTRIDEIAGIDTEWFSPYEIAKRMKWSKGRKMDSMNMMEQIFAIGEATTHLERMEEEGTLRSIEKGGVRLYRVSS